MHVKSRSRGGKQRLSGSNAAKDVQAAAREGGTAPTRSAAGARAQAVGPYGSAGARWAATEAFTPR